ncbi:DNA-binding protein YbiB [Ramlibacter sp. AN1015]|uniref:DNA-binding protein YbiB n=1 Tax=Ramlibacter sp. AN1015 TaxID=3133428 RepID=UPI0030C1C7E0
MGSISHYLKEIGRGKQGARALDRAQAADCFGQVLDGLVSDLEVGAFCMAMRIKGETPEEMCGFLDATAERSARVPAGERPLVVIPSYNGARKLPALTPLLGLLLARQGLAVLMHGAATEDRRVAVAEVLGALGVQEHLQGTAVAPGTLAWLPTQRLCPGLQRLLDVRRVVGVRNSAHSVVKLMNPCAGAAVIVSSYTHPEYAASMAEVFERTNATAMLLRGTEGEAVADARRLPQMDGFIRGQRLQLEGGLRGSVTQLPDLPCSTDPQDTARYIRAVLCGERAVPVSIGLQVEHIVRLASK